MQVHPLDDGLIADMPECEALHIVGYLQDIGYDNTSSAEVESWSRQTGIDLEAWEFAFVRRLSREYMRQYNDKTCPAPYRLLPEEISEHNAQAISDNVKKAMNSWLLSDS